MDIGFEGNFICSSKSINKDIHADWIEEDLGQYVRVSATPFETIFANDIRKDAKVAWVSYFENYKANAEEIYHLDSIVDLVKRAKSGEKIFPDNISVVTGGFPCQDFSIAGKRLGLNSQKSHNGKALGTDEPSIESRGQLYMWMRDVVTLTEPKLFIAENVKGLTSLEDVKEIIEQDFSKAGKDGYIVVPAKVLSAPDYGVPQSRERVIFYGFKKNALTEEAKKALSQKVIPDEYDPYPSKTHGLGLAPIVTCEDILGDLTEPDESLDLSQKSYSKAKYMGSLCQGQTENKMNSVAPTMRSDHHGNIEYRRLSQEHGGNHYDELDKGLPERRLSVRECARIQTFPDEYKFVQRKSVSGKTLSASDAYKIIGNAVPCVLAYNIAKNIENKWELYFGEKAK